MLLVGPLPTMYGAWVHIMTGLTQHTGLPENVLDHRLNCRTVYMNPVLRFIYWNMNYHVEHHMFPMVPYHRLPELHEEMKAFCPPAYPSVLAAYREIIPAIIRQAREPDWSISRPIPPAYPVQPAPAE
jgi:fatty acid desaturase